MGVSDVFAIFYFTKIKHSFLTTVYPLYSRLENMCDMLNENKRITDVKLL